jgi:hypothetical protein
MSRNSGSVCIPSTASATAGDSKKLITKDERNRKFVKQASEVSPVLESPEVPRLRKNGNRIGINQRMRIMQKFVVGKTQVAIAGEEGIDRETVRRVVRSPEMNAYIEEKRELWRGLCDEALETIRRLLRDNDKEVALRVLESNGVIPPQGATLNHNVQPATKPNQDDRVNNLRACFADVMMERARVFNTPFPELAEIADKNNIKLDFALNGASDEDEEDEI